MNMAAEGTGPAVPVEISVTTIDVKLADLLAQPYAIDVHESRSSARRWPARSPAATWGTAAGDTLAIGIKEVKGSGFSGVAVLQAAADKTTVTLYMAHGLSGAMQDGMATPVS